MVELIESAASAVSSTAAVIIVTVCACSSIAWRMRSAEVCTSSTVPWIEPLASTVWRVACWIAVILAVMSSVARAVCEARLFTSWATTAKPRPASPARAASMVALRARRLVWPAMSRIRPRIDSIASTWADSAWLTLTAWLAWSPARVATPAATSTSVRASSIARIRPGGGLRGFAHGDRRLLGGGGDFAGLAEHPARRSGGRAGAVGQRLGLLGAGADQLGDAALELLALAAALVGGLDRFEQRDLGEDDVGLDRARGAGRRRCIARACRARRRSARPFARRSRLSPSRARRCRSGTEVFSAIDVAAIFGDALDPGRVDLAGIDRRHSARRARGRTGASDFVGDDVGGMFSRSSWMSRSSEPSGL